MCHPTTDALSSRCPNRIRGCGGGLMKRLYRVTVTVEREFERVATREAKKVAIALGAEAIVRGWTVAKKVVTNRARAERSEREKPIDFGTIWEDVAASQAITTLREIAADMAAILGNVKRPRVEYAPNFWCDGRFTYNTAHAHNVSGVRWSRNLTGKYAKYAGRKIPKGLICISRKHLLRMDSEKWPWLMAHEIMHVRMPGGSHKRASFRENVDALLMKYEAMKQDHERRLDGALTESPEPKSVLDIDDGRSNA